MKKFKYFLIIIGFPMHVLPIFDKDRIPDAQKLSELLKKLKAPENISFYDLTNELYNAGINSDMNLRGVKSELNKDINRLKDAAKNASDETTKKAYLDSERVLSDIKSELRFKFQLNNRTIGNLFEKIWDSVKNIWSKLTDKLPNYGDIVRSARLYKLKVKLSSEDSTNIIRFLDENNIFNGLEWHQYIKIGDKYFSKLTTDGWTISKKPPNRGDEVELDDVLPEDFVMPE